MKTYVVNGLSLFALAAFLSACAVGPNYGPPKAILQGNWSEPLEGGTTNHSIQASAWWRTFNDPTLNSLIARAVKSNYDLRIADARLRQARAQRRFSAADFWPTIDASASYARERISAHGTFPKLPVIQPETDLYQAGFDAAWEVDVFGGKRRALEAATADVSASGHDRNDSLISLVAEVARNYLEVRGLQQRLAINARKHQIATGCAGHHTGAVQGRRRERVGCHPGRRAPGRHPRSTARIGSVSQANHASARRIAWPTAHFAFYRTRQKGSHSSDTAGGADRFAFRASPSPA